MASQRYRPLGGHAPKEDVDIAMVALNSSSDPSMPTYRGHQFERTHHQASDLSYAWQDEEQSLTRPWHASGWARFPWLSFVCLLLIVGLTIGIVVVLLVSDGKDIDAWGTTAVRLAGQPRSWQLSVSALIALFSFVSTRALAVMLVEAAAISWWVAATQGRTLGKLHRHWEVSQSFFAVWQRWSQWSWIYVASIAFVTFTALEALLQTASTSTTTLSVLARNMTAVVPTALPAGFSGVNAAISHDLFGTVYFQPVFNEIIQNYTSQTPIYLDLGGCDTTSNVSCTTVLQGIGFEYTCNNSRGEAQPIRIVEPGGSVEEPWITVFETQFGTYQDDVIDSSNDWRIKLGAAWQEIPGDDTSTATLCNCTLVPAIVEYPINVTHGTATLRGANATLNWTTVLADNNVTGFLVDRVLKSLTIPPYDTATLSAFSHGPGTFSTLGGFNLAFQQLFTSSIAIKGDITNDGADIRTTGAFASPYADFLLGTSNQVIWSNTFRSPMPQLLSQIRDIMFRSSVVIAQRRVADYVRPADSTDNTGDTVGTNIPIENSTTAGMYQIYHTVYKTNRVMLGVSVGLMSLAVLAILPLYWGFWRLGRKVSLSPIEVARALYRPSVTDPNSGTESSRSVLDLLPRSSRGSRTHLGTNLSADELIKLLGRIKVRYGEVAPGWLGIAPADQIGWARPDQKYE